MKLTLKQARELGIKVPGGVPKLKMGRGRQSNDKKYGCDKVFDALCKSHGLPVPVHEYAWHETRGWRFDFLFEGWLAVEKVGGVWIRGHHSRGKDQIEDMERRNEAQIMGFQVLEFTPQDFDSGEAFAVIRRALDAGEERP